MKITLFELARSATEVADSATTYGLGSPTFSAKTNRDYLEEALAQLRYIEELLCEQGLISEDRIQETFVKLYSKTEVDKK